MVVHNPETADYGSTELYTAIAEKINNTYDNVERGLRVMLSSAFRKGVILNGKVEQRRMKNKELIILLAEEFKKNHTTFKLLCKYNTVTFERRNGILKIIKALSTLLLFLFILRKHLNQLFVFASTLRAFNIRRAPSEANLRAHPSPIPLDAPVINTILSIL